MYEDSKPVDVYPKNRHGQTLNIDFAFETKPNSNVPNPESSILTIMSSKPELLGPGLKLVQKEFDTGTGIVDLLFQDSERIHVLVEGKDTADQETVGQVQKQSRVLAERRVSWAGTYSRRRYA